MPNIGRKGTFADAKVMVVINMKKIFSYVVDVLILAIIILVTVKMIFEDTNMSVIIEDLKSANKIWISFGVVLVLLFVCSESVIIKYMLRMFGTKIPLLRCIKYSFVGFFVSYITPSASGGQPAQVFYMKKDGIKIGHSTLIMVVIAFAYKLVLIILGLPFLIFRYSQICSYVGNLAWLLIIGFILNIVYIALLGALVVKPLWIKAIGVKCINFLAKIRIIKRREKYINKIDRICDNYTVCADYIKNNLLAVVKITLITIVQRIFLFAVTYVVYKSFGLSGTSFLDIIAIQTMIAIAVEMLPLPGAAGITEGCFVKMFATVFGSGLVKPGMLLSRGLSFYVVLIIGALVTAAAHIIMLRKTKRSKTTG